MIGKIEMIEKIGMIVSLNHRFIETLNLWDNEQMNQWTNGSMDKWAIIQFFPLLILQRS